MEYSRMSGYLNDISYCTSGLINAYEITNDKSIMMYLNNLLYNTLQKLRTMYYRKVLEPKLIGVVRVSEQQNQELFNVTSAIVARLTFNMCAAA